ncbi:PREDICTED: spectrin alpha chain, non-erythrocytic 1-like [Amphimedon queenslandica]|uniref:EF-hand domain-containing protein n=1 Tax=Amphimedon queenslandica TaxID=400682 RepID=A0AAN0JH96_AMPQE|nr:PREDICTED: spectrin alpha chain, non-erythrocytic 1-like [Amphimedon queenslandica]|eukprot:XP_019856334.1 PREDICTED: spectrin alpha chain, non-erythrocytic 1-like [Amphimedon queenslandica]
MKDREAQIEEELKRQRLNEDLRKLFARQANQFYSWLTETRTIIVDSTGSLEIQLEAIKAKSEEIESRQEHLKHIEELGAKVEKDRIFDNKYTEHTPVSLNQLWDQLRQLTMRLQHNLEQQIQARNMTGVSEDQLREFSTTFKYFDKNQSGRLEHQEFKASLRSLGYELAVLEQGQTDPKFEAILDQVDPNRLGYITSEEYMSFLISRETENVQTMAEIEDAFAAISGEREKLYVTREELLQALPVEQAEYCMSKMKLYVDSNGLEIRDCYNYKDFTKSLF